RLDQRHPLLHRALAATHADFERLLRHRLVREDADEELPLALGGALDRHTTRLDLSRREPRGLHCLPAEVPERDVRATPGEAAVLTAHLFSELGSLGRKHG